MTPANFTAVDAARLRLGAEALGPNPSVAASHWLVRQESHEEGETM